MSANEGFPSKILIVDDKEQVRDSLRSRVVVTSRLYTVKTAGSGAEALDRLAAEGFDIVLCDLVLGGGMDGVETTRRICEASPTTRVVLFSGKEGEGRRVEALKAGAHSYLSKPVNFDELFDTIGKLSSIRRTEQLKGSFETLARVAYELQGTFDQTKLAERIVLGARELGHQRARLYLLDPEGQLLIGQVSLGSSMGVDFKEYLIPMAARPIIRYIFSRDRPSVWNREILAERFGEESMEPWMTDLDLHNVPWIDCPLVVGNARIGTLSLDDHDRPGRIYRDEDLEIMGVFSGLAAQALNNSQLYRKEALAKASLQRVLEEAPDSVVTTDRHGVIQFASPSTTLLIGTPRERIVRQRAADLYTDERGTPGAGEAVAREMMRELLKQGPISNRKVYLRGSDGVPRPVSISVSLLHDDQGKKIGTSGFIKDLGIFEAQTRRYRDLLEGFGYGSVLLNQAGEIDYINRKAELLLGCDNAQGRKLAELILPAQRQVFEQRFAEVLTRDAEESLDFTVVRAEGGQTPAKAHLSPFQPENGPKGVSVSLYGASEIASLIQSGRLMALGQMVAGVAHEINNPLNNILPTIRDFRLFLSRQQLLSERAEECIVIIERNGTRIGEIVRQLREFARPGEFRRVPLSLNRVVKDSVAFFQTRLRNNNVRLVLDLPDDLPQILGDSPRLQQVFVNLVINAEEAMEDQTEPKEIRIVSRAEPPGFVQVEVSDTGSGVPEHARGLLFNSFFTTKPPNKGTGLGLPISRSIIADFHEGEIELVDRPNQRGACFRIQLKAVE